MGPCPLRISGVKHGKTYFNLGKPSRTNLTNSPGPSVLQSLGCSVLFCGCLSNGMVIHSPTWKAVQKTADFLSNPLPMKWGFCTNNPSFFTEINDLNHFWIIFESVDKSFELSFKTRWSSRCAAVLRAEAVHRGAFKALEQKAPACQCFAQSTC